MRIIIIVLLLLAVMIACGLYTERTLEKQASTLQQELDNLEKGILTKNRDETFNQLKTIESLWLKWRRLWVLLIDHHELENFELSLARTKAFLRAETAGGVSFILAEIATMKQLATQIPDKQNLTLENIF